MSLPVTRPTGRALVVGAPSHRATPTDILARVYSYQCDEADDPFAAMVSLAQRRFVYHAVVLSLASIFRSELAIITTVKRRFPHVEVWLAHTDGRQALLAEAMRLGADGLLAEDGLHRMAPATEQPLRHPDAPAGSAYPTSREVSDISSSDPIEPTPGEPVLTSDELRALLQDQPSMPPSGTTEQT